MFAIAIQVQLKFIACNCSISCASLVSVTCSVSQVKFLIANTCPLVSQLSYSKISFSQWYIFRDEMGPAPTTNRIYYHPQTKLREGNVFTPVCDSVHRGSSIQGGLCLGWSLSKGGGGSLSRGVSVRPMYGKERAVCILLECILVFNIFKKCLGKVDKKLRKYPR